MLLYKLFLFLYPKLAYLLSFFNEKAKQWCIGQKQVWNEIDSCKKSIKGPIIWVHAASYGEFEQGLPIIEKIKKAYPHYQIWLTFFSPSGYLHRKNDPSVDFVTYLPLDSADHAAKFLQLIQPELILFIKYEFWYHYLVAAKQKKIPTLLVSAIFRPDQIFFTPYGGFYRKMLSLFTRILVQDHDSQKLIQKIYPVEQIDITGDTRFDRVYQIAKQPASFNWLNNLAPAPIIITGSTWPSDHSLLAKVIPSIAANWIIVPHHVDAAAINQCKKTIPGSITLSEFEKIMQQGETFKHVQILIIDSIGMLRNLYHYAQIAYVGGGFTKDGIHNVLEPAAFGKPVIWGPNDIKYREAIGLRNVGGGIVIKDATSLITALNELLSNKEKATKMSQLALNYIQENAGATDKTMNIIYEKRLLTN